MKLLNFNSSALTITTAVFAMTLLSSCGKQDATKPKDKISPVTVPVTTIPNASLSLSATSLTLKAGGKSRSVSITPHADAQDVTYTLSAPLPEGTTITPFTCGSIPATESCVLTVYPGKVAGAPVTLSISGVNTDTVEVSIAVVELGSLHQGGYVFAINDETPSSQSIGGKVVRTKDDGRMKTWAQGTPYSVGATSLTDGAANTALMVKHLGENSPAAMECANFEIDDAGNTPCRSGSKCHKEWYVPALCELAPFNGTNGCPEFFANVTDNLFRLSPSIGNIRKVPYWTSTEDEGGRAWIQQITQTSDLSQSVGKNASQPVRCVRKLQD